MVEQTQQLDAIFGSLSDPTRRDIIKRLSDRGMAVGAIAEQYRVSLAAVAKHVGVLERAGLVRKTRQGKAQIVTLEPQALAAANDYLEAYKKFWEHRLDSLDELLKRKDNDDE